MYSKTLNAEYSLQKIDLTFFNYLMYNIYMYITLFMCDSV